MLGDGVSLEDSPNRRHPLSRCRRRGTTESKITESFFLFFICIYEKKSVPLQRNPYYTHLMGRMKVYILAAACLIIGVLLYATCRTDIWFVHRLHLDILPHTTLDSQNPFIYWLIFCLPDGLWYMSLLILQQQLTQRKSVSSRICMYAAVVLPFLLEGMQAAGWLFGTFDYRDIITYLFTLILFLCLREKLYSSDCKCSLSPSL